MIAKNAWPHWGSLKETGLPTNVKSTMPRKTRVRQISKSPASPAPTARSVTPIGQFICVCTLHLPSLDDSETSANPKHSGWNKGNQR